MRPILLYVGAFAAIVAGTTMNNFYLFVWGCTWWLSATILESRDEARRAHERLDEIVHAFDPLATSRAINKAAASGHRGGAR